MSIGLTFRQQIPIELNSTRLVIGEVIEARFLQDSWEQDGYLDCESLGVLCASELDRYHRTERLQWLPYAKPGHRAEKSR